MSTSIVASYNDAISVSFNSDAWFNATTVASSFGKRPVDWLKLDSTKEYISSLCEILRSEQSALLKTKRGRAVKGGETWFHPKLGVAFARWLDVKFAIWCDMQVEKILHGQSDQPTLESPTITPSEQQTLHEIVARRSNECADIGKARAEIWRRVHHKFRVAKYQQLQREQLSDAIAYVMQMDIKTPPVPAMPAPERTAHAVNPTYSYAREQLDSLSDWGRRALPPTVQTEFFAVTKELERALIRGWTEMDEAVLHMAVSMAMLKRWKRAH